MTFIKLALKDYNVRLHRHALMKICVYLNVFICFYLHTILYNGYYQDILTFLSFYCNYKTRFLIVF